MSQESAEEVARRWIWAFENDGDVFREILHPEVEWFPFEENHTCFYGIESAVRVRSQWLDTWRRYEARRTRWSKAAIRSLPLSA
jgi:hypothetical protein